MPPVNSSVVKSIQYDALARALTVRLANGVYVYEDVPESVYRAFLAAPSKGAFYNSRVRDCFPIGASDLSRAVNVNLRLRHEVCD